MVPLWRLPRRFCWQYTLSCLRHLGDPECMSSGLPEIANLGSYLSKEEGDITD